MPTAPVPGICRSIDEQHGGSITAKGVADPGSELVVAPATAAST